MIPNTVILEELNNLDKEVDNLDHLDDYLASLQKLNDINVYHTPIKDKIADIESKLSRSAEKFFNLFETKVHQLPDHEINYSDFKKDIKTIIYHYIEYDQFYKNMNIFKTDVRNRSIQNKINGFANKEKDIDILRYWLIKCLVPEADIFLIKYITLQFKRKLNVTVKDYYWLDACYYGFNKIVHDINNLPCHHINIINEFINKICSVYNDLSVKVELCINLEANIGIKYLVIFKSRHFHYDEREIEVMKCINDMEKCRNFHWLNFETPDNQYKNNSVLKCKFYIN